MEIREFIEKYKFFLIILAIIGIAIYSSGGHTYLSQSQNCGGFSMNRQGEYTTKLPSILYSTPTNCKDYIYDNKRIEDDYAPAYCKAVIHLSTIYGRDCTKYPYIDYAKINVKCEGDRLYVYEGEPDDDWNDIKPRIKCGRGYCTGYDRSFPAGEHEITLKNTPGKMNSYFFVCYDYDYENGWWCWSWTGWGFWGDRKVVKSECSPGDTKCEGYNYYECSNYKWKDKGKVIGKCGVECSLGKTKCEGYNYYECSNYKWKDKGKVIGKCGVECLEDRNCGETTVSDNYCYNGNVYRNITKNICQNYKCIQQTEKKLIEKCKYGCEGGECIGIFGFENLWYIAGGVIAFLIIMFSLIYYKLKL